MALINGKLLSDSGLGGYKQLLIALAGSVFGTVIIFVVTRSGGIGSSIGLIFIVLGAAIWIMAWRNWEFGVQALLVVVVIEGAIRKWFLPSFSEFVYFYKDILMLILLSSYLSQREKLVLLVKPRLKMFLATLTAFILYCIAVVGNPSLPHPLVGLFGIKAYCLYIPLFFIVPRMLTSKEKLVGFLRWYLVIALPVALIGMMQFMEPMTAPINQYAWSEEAIQSTANVTGSESVVASFKDAEGNDYVRITSTFSYISGLTVFLPTMFALLLGITSLRSTRGLPGKVRSVYYLAMGAVIVAALMSGSRAAILVMIVIAVFYYSFISLKDLFRKLRQVLIAGVLIYIALVVFFPQAYDAFYTRTFQSDENVEEGLRRIYEAFNLPIEEAGYAGAFGYGVGAAQNAVPTLMSALNLPFMGERIPIAYEVESARIVLELGVVGYILYMLMRLCLLVIIWRTTMSIQDAESKTLALVSLGALLMPLVYGGAMISHTQNIYQWFLAGVPLALLNAERMSKEVRRPNSDSLFRRHLPTT